MCSRLALYATQTAVYTRYNYMEERAIDRASEAPFNSHQTFKILTVRATIAVVVSSMTYENGGYVTEAELRLALNHIGWGLHLRARRANGNRYAYARRNRQNKLVTIYLCPEHKIGELNIDTIRQKLIQDVTAS